MDLAVTNIMGVIFGAVLYFVGHSFVLALANPSSLFLLPFIGVALEYYARFYRTTIREVQRVYLVCMSSVYQDMVEAILGKVTIRAFAASRNVICSTVAALDDFQQVYFTKITVGQWIGLRMSLIGYTLTIFNRLYPILQLRTSSSTECCACRILHNLQQ